VSLYISGQPIPTPQGVVAAYKLLASPQPSQNLVSVTYTDTSPKAKQNYKKTLQGIALGLGSLYSGCPATLLANVAAEKIFPSLKNKVPYFLIGGGLASISGAIAGLALSISNANKMKKKQPNFFI
jgi:hypothetical protein